MNPARLFPAFLAAIAVGAGATAGLAQLPRALPVARQLVVVTTPGWDSTTGTLRYFARPTQRDRWQPAGAPIPVVVGRTGLAWGTPFDQLVTDPQAPHKREGDGRSPAGAFPLDTAFGFAPRDAMLPLHMAYVQLTPATDCVDDTASVHYNTIVSRDAAHVDWTSAEHMRQIAQYRIGVVVGYNAVSPLRGRGSCIFLHVWAGPGSTTVGCTALDARALEQLMEWLDRSKQPVLVQLPAGEYDRLRARWSLPERSE